MKRWPPPLPVPYKSKWYSGTPRDSLNVLRLLAGCPSKLQIRISKSLSRLEFRVLRRSKAGFTKFRELQNGTFSGTIPSVGPPEIRPKVDQLQSRSILYSNFMISNNLHIGEVLSVKSLSKQNGPPVPLTR